jgi:hypothetical protein
MNAPTKAELLETYTRFLCAALGGSAVLTENKRAEDGKAETEKVASTATSIAEYAMSQWWLRYQWSAEGWIAELKEDEEFWRQRLVLKIENREDEL